MLIRRTAAFLLALAAVETASLAGPPTLAELAPEHTMLLMTGDDMAMVVRRLRRTPLGDLVPEGSGREMMAGMLEGLGLDVPPEDVPGLPQGMFGVALFAVVDAETGMPIPGYLMAADFGRDAGRMDALIGRALERGQEAGDLRFEQIDAGQRRITVIDISPKLDELDDEIAGAGAMMPAGMGDPDAFDAVMDRALSKVHYVREDGVLMWSSDGRTVRDVLATFDGQGMPRLADRPEYRALIGQIGASDWRTVFLPGELGTFVAGLDTMQLTTMFAPMIKQVIGDIQGVASGVRLDGRKGMIEATSAFYMPHGKMGLTAVMDTPAPRGALPVFVGPDAVSYSVMNVDFRRIPEALEPVMQMARMMMPPEPGAAGAGPDQLLGQVCAALGDRYHEVQVMEDPDDVASLRRLSAVECARPEELDAFLAAIAPAMGLEARDAGERRVYTLDPMAAMGPMMGGMGGMGGGGMDEDVEPEFAMNPIAFTVAGSYLFAGAPDAVDRALVAVDADAAGRRAARMLSDRPGFRRAELAFPETPLVGWGYVDLPAVMKASLSASRRAMEQVELEDDMADWPLMTEDDFDRYAGPAAWYVESTATGFIAKVVVLEPAPEIAPEIAPEE